MAGTTVAARQMEIGGSNLETTKTVNLIVDDLEVLRSALSAGGVVAVTELMADHATFKTAVDQTETLIEEMHDDHATNKALLDELLFKVAFLVHRDQNRNTTGTSPVFAIDTNFDVKNTETCAFIAAGVPYTLTDNTSCDTGTSKTIAASQWAAFVIDATNATTLAATWTADAASEAAAIALVRAVPFVAGKCRLGYVTVNAHASGFTAGTDALTGGAGGNVATATNYYQFFDLVPITTVTSAATLTAPKPASAPATLSASVPTSTVVDNANDLLAYKVANDQGTVIA
jgi:hypothetical protein